MARGKLITIEGLDGAGKTTLAAGLLETLRGRDIPAQLLREPGGVKAAEDIRALVKDPAAHIFPRAEALLYAAARAQLVQEALEPLLERGSWVVLDRFVDSSLVYQGAGRGLGIAPVLAINEFATSGLTPDLTLLVRVDPRLGRERSRGRGAPDRLELEPDGFFERVGCAYDELARLEPQRIVIIDGDQPPPTVLAEAIAALERLV